ncbi:MAG TPA: hypothetical protein VHW04_14320 [Solirubrobacteraceae bacterium]|nr:hypothetical protein [Solirubrobacteraceae bacterium]
MSASSSFEEFCPPNITNCFVAASYAAAAPTRAVADPTGTHVGAEVAAAARAAPTDAAVNATSAKTAAMISARPATPAVR